MKKYKLQVIISPAVDHPEVISKGNEGWELVTVIQLDVQVSALAPPSKMLVFYFQKEIEDGEEKVSKPRIIRSINPIHGPGSEKEQ